MAPPRALAYEIILENDLLGPTSGGRGMSARPAIIDRPGLAFWALLVLIVGVRVFALRQNALELHFDEAQYWAWSRTLDWGYFSKPPLIAWTIAFATSLLGDAEWVIRLAAPLAHGVAAIALYKLARSMYAPWAGFWAGLGWLLMPAVSLSSGVISTDALLLPLWALALLAFWRLVATRAWSWAVWLGVFVGLGALAKYAMLYFLVCAFFAALWAPPARKALLSTRGLLALLIGFAVLAPNLYWNVQHAFATVGHTAANASISGFALHWNELLTFLRDQIIMGPIAFVILLGLFVRAIRRWSGLSNEDHFLLAFILPPLVIISGIALLSRANANWAAAAYPAAIVWLSGSLLAWRGGARWLSANAGLNAVLGAVMVAIAISPAFAERIGLANALKRTRGWEATADAIAERALPASGEAPFTAVLVDDRATYFELTYYWREDRREGVPLPPVRMWLLHNHALNSAEQTDPMREEEGARVLVVHARPQYLPLVAGDFTGFRTVEHISIPVGGERTRNYEISVGELFAPAPRDDAFEARIPE